MGALNPGRLAAARALLRVENGMHAEDALAELVPADSADRALAWHLVLGVLRRRGALDQVISRVARRPVEGIDLAARVALRLGLFEARLCRTAVHAAVDQAVEVCRALGRPQAAGFVNAVLRRAMREPISEDPSINLPTWLSERWAAWPDWVARLGEAPPLNLVTRPAQGLPEALAGAPATAAGQPVADVWSLSSARGTVDRLPGYSEGRWWVMDPASAVVADLALEAAGPAPRVLDACAAPGGKTFRLISRGAEVLSVDNSAERLARLARGAERLGLSVETRLHDWLDGPLPQQPLFDVVLVDAPCTGLGTVRRHPEIRWLRLPSDPAAMALRQREILAAASAHVRPGGALVYAVCSPMKEEGADVASRLAGWAVERSWTSAPPAGDEDAFQAFVLRAKERVIEGA